MIWPGVPSSQVLTSSPPPRFTIKASSDTTSIADQLSEFLGSGKVTFTSLTLFSRGVGGWGQKAPQPIFPL